MESVSELKASIYDYENYKDIFEILFINSASKYEKYQNLLGRFINYFKQLLNLSELLLHIFKLSPEKQINIYIGSNLPFCGDFNFNIKKRFLNYDGVNINSHFVFVGRQLENIGKGETKYFLPFPKNIESIESISEVYEKILELRNKSLICFVRILFNNLFRFSLRRNNNTSVNELLVDDEITIPLVNSSFVKENIGNILKFEIEELFITSENEKIFFDPNIDEFLVVFFDFFLKNSLYFSFLSSFVAENYVRMVAMSHARDEAEKRIRSLRNQLNKRRQSKITRELTELMNNFEHFQ